MKNLTLLLALTLLLVLSAGFTIGLTYAPCFASMCPEDFFPYVTRIHVAGYYAILASIGVMLLLRAYIPWIRSISSTYLIQRELLILKKRVSLGGLTLATWIVGLTVASTAFWIDAEINFWALRTDALDWADANIRLAVTGIIGHHCDILLGLVVIPVSRNSILGRVFVLHQSTLLYAHKLLAYAFLIVVIAHGGAYYTFVATYAAAGENSPRKNAFNIDNPTLTIPQSEAKPTYWSYVTLPTGMLAFLAMLVIIITALPILRRKSYNTFYYIHVVGSMLVFFLSSVHASTDFYFLLPGLLLWILDWGLRLFRGDAGGLTKKVNGTLEDAGYGWCRLTLPVAAKASQDSYVEKEGAGRAMKHPLQTYYLNIPIISKLQNHAFTAAKIGSSESGPVFLFQRSTPRLSKRKQAKQEKEWTWKAAAAIGTTIPATESVDDIEPVTRRRDLEVRVEGPYIPSETTALETADKIVCIVGGTGLTGAYSLAMWWLEHRSKELNATFVLIWTVRQREIALVSEWRELEERARTVGDGKMMPKVHVSSEEGRMNADAVLRQHLAQRPTKSGKEPQSRAAWVYVSGPEGLLRKAEDACVNLEKELRVARRKGEQAIESGLQVDCLEHYVAKWEV